MPNQLSLEQSRELESDQIVKLDKFDRSELFTEWKAPVHNDGPDSLLAYGVSDIEILSGSDLEQSPAVPPIDSPVSEDAPVNIDNLIEELGNDEFTTREGASRQLLLQGDRARAKLEIATKSGDLEVARRAEDILSRLRDWDRFAKMGSKMTPELYRAIGGISDNEFGLITNYFKTLQERKAAETDMGSQGTAKLPDLDKAIAAWQNRKTVLSSVTEFAEEPETAKARLDAFKNHVIPPDDTINNGVLQAVIKDCPNLKKIDLTLCDIDNDSVSMLSDKCKNLKSLNLQGTSINSECFPALNHMKLEQVILSGQLADDAKETGLLKGGVVVKSALPSFVGLLGGAPGNIAVARAILQQRAANPKMNAPAAKETHLDK